MEVGKLNAYITEYGYGIDDVDLSDVSASESKLYRLFIRDSKKFIYELAFEPDVKGSISIAFLQHLGKGFIKRIVSFEGINFGELPNEDLSVDECDLLVPYVPLIIGHEFVDYTWIQNQYSDFVIALESELRNSTKSISEFLIAKGVDVVIPSRIYFHLVENKLEEGLPFAFLATYTAQNGEKVVHIPLKNALVEFKNDSHALELLIKSIKTAAKESDFAFRYMESGDIYFPVKLNQDDAYSFLKEVPIFEKYGIVCRIPKWYTEKDSKILVDMDEKKLFSSGYLSQIKLNSFQPTLIYHGIEITIEEAKDLISKTEGLEYIKGRWVENDHEELQLLLSEYEEFSGDGTTLLEILKSKAGFNTSDIETPTFIEFSRKDWIQQYINHQFASNIDNSLPSNFAEVLRHYQKDAFSWLLGMYSMGFGVCLADDMGLGKTVEVLSFLSKYKNDNDGHVLIIVPATLIANWKAEIEKFSPDMDVFVLRGNNAPNDGCFKSFITITTYQTAMRSDYISSVFWDITILDEAQAIKNYYTSQTKKIKSLDCGMRIAMTGTPIENNVLELWSIFDFLNPGLLGNREEFKALYLSGEGSQKRIKELIQPFVLRRVKTDKNIISDLPEKNEMDITINLTKEQIILYRKAVSDMNDAIERIADKRKSQILVLSAVMKLKQICNHPSQYLGDDTYDESLSGKFIELRNIAETIYSKREKVLVFTQFKEIIPALDKLLSSVFCKNGACIDGDTSMSRRAEYVSMFQEGKLPYMVLSLKTAGVGLNLTAAQNVIHFDRWWNPAVENQATDRAYRIGQKNDVTVYKFVTADTIEEVINRMIKDKQLLADEYINDLDSNILSKLSTDELMKAVAYGGDDE